MVEKLEDILTRFGNKVANKQDRAGQGRPRSLGCCLIVIRFVISSLPIFSIGH